MEGNLSSRNIMQSDGSYGGFDLQAPMRNHHHHNHHHQQQQPHLTSHPRQGSSSMAHHPIHENFPLTIGTNQEDQNISITEYNKGKSGSDEDEPDDPMIKGKKSSSTWQRVKWTDTMVRLLITAVSYITEEASSEPTRRKYMSLQKKGKWKSVSKVMAERGHFVSPQQCEDKFNDLNKRYKRLNEILGRGTSCEVVENPALLDMMNHVSEKLKEEVRKILSSKHLHYEEMCSYHNGNRLHLPADPELQRSLRLALRSRDENDENDLKKQENDDPDDHDGEFDDHDRGEYDEDYGDHHGGYSGFRKRAKNCGAHESLFGFNFGRENVGPEPEGPANNQWMRSKSLELEEQRVHIEAKMLELEKERFKWQRFSRKKDREMEMMRMEIERMKLENERMALELRRKEMGIDG